MSLKSKIQNLISAGNDVTGLADSTLTDVVQSLIDGYGQAGTRYTIVWNLSKVTSTSSRSRIPEGQPLTATLSAETGYSMTSVVVLMGGVDITSSAYNNGQINILSVTGNVIISASAEATLSYSSFKGFVTPFNGAYNDWMYDKMIPVGNKIYMNYAYQQSHYNSNGETKKSALLCYDTETETVEWERPCICDGVIFNSQIMKLIDDKLYIWNGDGYRYESSDWGRTWTKTACTGMSSDWHYAIVTSTGRIIASAPGSGTHNYLYSDDDGLTWSTITNPFGSTTYVTSHNCFFEEDGKIIAYLFAPMYTNNNQNATRYVSYSEDNGTTWTTPTACTGDLASAGSSYMTGQIIKFGGEYHYITAARYFDTDGNGGRLEWYKGTLAELLSGTLTLVQTIYKNYGKARIDDSGNMGACACNGAIYINYAGLLVVPGGSPTSNQGIRLFKLTKEQETDTVVPEVNENYKDKYNALIAGKSTSPRYYLYDGEATIDAYTSRNLYTPPAPVINFGDVSFNIMGRFSTCYMPNVPILRYDVHGKDFEVNIVFSSFYTCGFGQTTTNPFMIIGFEKADGTIHAVLHQKANGYNAVFNAADLTGYAAAMMGATTSNTKTYNCVTFKRVNGDLFFEVDGITVKNPIYSNLQENSRFQSQSGKDNIFIAFIGNDGNVEEYNTWYETGIASTTSQSYSGIRLLTIDY